MDSQYALGQFRENWEKEIQEVHHVNISIELTMSLSQKGPEKASIVRTMFKIYKKRLFLTWFYIFLYSGFALVGPAYFFRELIVFTDQEDTQVGFGIFLALGFMASDSLRSLTAHQYWARSAATSSMFRNMVIGESTPSTPVLITPRIGLRQSSIPARPEWLFSRSTCEYVCK